MTDTDPILAAQQEVDSELAMAFYLVPTIDDAAALEAIELSADVAGEAAVPIAVASLRSESAPTLVLVGAVPLSLAREIQAAVPRTVVRSLRSVSSAAVQLCYTPGVTRWTERQADAAYRTWLAIASRDAITEIENDGSEPAAATGGAPFPVAALPDVCRRMVTEGAVAQGVDVAYWAVPLLGVLSGCVGATRTIRLKRSWHEPAVLWPVVIAPSGAGKSAGLRELLAPVRNYDHQRHEQCMALQQAAAAAAQHGQQAAPVPMRCALIGDVTSEAVAVRLSDNPRGLLLAADELAGWVQGWNRYRSGGDEQSWLELHNAGALVVDRKGDPKRIMIRSAAVAVTGTIQPGVARRVLGAPERRASGAAARLLLSAPPVARARWTDCDIGNDTREEYSRAVRGLLSLELDERGGPVSLSLDSEAQRLFIEFHDRNGSACHVANLGGEHDVAAAMSKLRGGAARFALVIALARAAEDGTAALLRVVDARAMRAGIAVADWFDGEARRIYAEWDAAAADDTATQDRSSLHALADRLARVLDAGPKSLDQLHDATGKNLTGHQMRGALAILAASGRASCDRSRGTRGRPREIWSRVDGGCPG
jgi:hypothetical protein